MSILDKVRVVRGVPDDVVVVAPVSVMTKDRLQRVLEESRSNAIWYRIKCDLCLGWTTFESSDDLWEWRCHGYCQCGHRFDLKMETGTFPGGKIFIWDEEEVLG